MIIVNLKGGLGNQMFQYALGRILALKNKDTLKLDTSGYPRQKLRAYGLDTFNIVENIATKKEIRKLKYPYSIFSMLWRRFSFKILQRHHIGWEPEALKRTGDIYLDGFWQSYKYFADQADIIKQDFSLKEPLENKYPDLVDKVKKTASVSLHIRRGDYANSKITNYYHGTCSPRYYREAIEIIKNKVTEPVFFIFTDEPAWAKANLQFIQPAVFVADYQLSDGEELALMKICQHNIIANSTFSWWGAWLNSHPDKIVIAPKKWANKDNEAFKDLIPPKWIRI